MKLLDRPKHLLSPARTEDVGVHLPYIDTSGPIQIPDSWITWPGKERGEPKPPIIWLDRPSAAGSCTLGEGWVGECNFGSAPEPSTLDEGQGTGGDGRLSVAHLALTEDSRDQPSPSDVQHPARRTDWATRNQVQSVIDGAGSNADKAVALMEIGLSFDTTKRILRLGEAVHQEL